MSVRGGRDVAIRALEPDRSEDVAPSQTAKPALIVWPVSRRRFRCGLDAVEGRDHPPDPRYAAIYEVSIVGVEVVGPLSAVIELTTPHLCALVRARPRSFRMSSERVWCAVIGTARMVSWRCPASHAVGHGLELRCT